MSGKSAKSIYAERLTALETSINADPSRALKALRALRREAIKAGEPETLTQYCALLTGRCMQRSGRSGEAFNILMAATRRLDELGAASEAATGYHYLSQIYAGRHDAQAALECCVRGQELARRARDWYLIMNLELDMAPFVRGDSKSTAAVEKFLHGLDIYFKHVKGKDRRIEGQEEYTEFIIAINIAINYFNIKDYASAKRYLDSVAGSELRVLNGMYADLYHLEYARICFASDMRDEGIRHTDIVKQRLAEREGRSLHGAGNNYLALIKELIHMKETDRAKALIDMVRPAMERDDNPRLLGVLSLVLATYFCAVGDKDEGIKHYGEYAEFISKNELRESEDNKRIMLRRVELQTALRRRQAADDARARQMEALQRDMAYKAEREEILDNLSENTDNFFLLYNPSTRSVDFMSRNSARLFGLDAQATSDPCGELFKWLGMPERDARRFYAGDIQERFNADYAVRNRQSGERITVHQALIPTPGKLIIMVLTDITRLTVAIETARRASAAKTDFLSNMSHDIRTPLSAVVGLMDLLEEDLHDAAAARAHIEKMRVSARHLTDLINDMLDMSRIEAGQMVVNSDAFTMRSFLDSILSLILPQADMRGQKLTLHADKVGDDALIGDPLRMRQAFVNILGNAVKFTAPGGSITLGARVAGAREDAVDYVFTFADNGCGMSPDFLPHVFKPFERAESEARDVQGTGLGMAITKRIVDMLGGRIEVESAPGVGTTFTLYLTIKRDRSARDTRLAPTRKASETRRRGVALVVEDNAINLEIVCRMVEKLGLSCRVATDGQMAVSMFEKSAIDEYAVVLMDVRMPVMNGHEATRRIRAMDRSDAKRVPILAMTADAFEEDVRKALDAGMDAHIAKPVDIHLISAALDRFLIEN